MWLMKTLLTSRCVNQRGAGQGKHTPDFEMMCKLAKILKVPESYFYTIDDEMAEILLVLSKLSLNDKNKALKFIVEISKVK